MLCAQCKDDDAILPAGLQPHWRDTLAKLVLRVQDMGSVGSGTGEELPDEHWRGILAQLILRLQDGGEQLPRSLGTSHDAKPKGLACEAVLPAFPEAALYKQTTRCKDALQAPEVPGRGKDAGAMRSAETCTGAAPAAMETEAARRRDVPREVEAACRLREAAEQLRVVEANAALDAALAQARLRTSQAEKAAVAEVLQIRMHACTMEAAAEIADARAHLHRAEAEAAVHASKMRSLARMADAEAAGAEAEAEGGAGAGADGRAERSLLAEHSGSGAAEDAWTSVANELPEGLSQRMLDAEVALREGRAGEGTSSGDGAKTAAALRRARELHVQLEGEVCGMLSDNGWPVMSAGMVAWGVFLAAALDGVLRMWSAPANATRCPPGAGYATAAVAAPAFDGPRAFHRQPSPVPPRAGLCSPREPPLGVPPAAPVQPGSCGAPLWQARPVAGERLRGGLHEPSLQRSARSGPRSAASDASGAETESSMDAGTASGEHSSWDALRAVDPESELPISIAQLQRSAALDRVRLQEEVRTLRLQRKLQQARERSPSLGSPRPQRPRSPAARRTPSPAAQRRGSPCTPRPPAPGPRRPECSPARCLGAAAVPGSSAERAPAARALPAALAEHLNSSPALLVAAKRWGCPPAASRAATPPPCALPRRQPSSCRGSTGGQCRRGAQASAAAGASARCNPFTPVRASHLVLHRPMASA
mmetsp:Transcript_22508/g.69674  ORF Transcript_22508/g.69674 Transcript_22508/m.69674 type:complete len:708 (-) Transcript_22508:262-2385(-)